MLPKKRIKRQNPGGENGEMDSVMPFLPQEIVTNILKRLPVKSLLRFRCVCKDWENLIKTQSFISEHLHHSIQNPSLLFQQNPKGDPFCLYSIDRHIKPLQLLNVPISHPGIRIGIVDSTNGLVCLKADKPGFCLPSFLVWNPATRKAKPLKPSINDFKGKCHAAFGFCPVSNDYKTMLIHYDDNDEDEGEDEDEYEDGDGDGDLAPILVEVHSLCTGLWKRVNYYEKLKPVSQIVTVNGVMFYCGLENDDDEICIISFDLAKEAFSRIPIPAIESDNPAIESDEGFDLVVHDNKLAIAAQTWSESLQSFVLCLWVMEEGIGASEERWKWTKKYNISFSSGLLLPTCIWKNEFVGTVNDKASGHNIEAECEEKKKQNEAMTVLSMINFSTKQLLSFPIHIPRCNESSALFNYAESLVPTCW